MRELNSYALGTARIANIIDFRYTGPVPESEKKPEPPVDWTVYSMVFETGYTIAIPLVLFALGGRYLDKVLGTSPLILLAGILISIVISSVLIYKKVSKIIK